MKTDVSRMFVRQRTTSYHSIPRTETEEILGLMPDFDVLLTPLPSMFDLLDSRSPSYNNSTRNAFSSTLNRFQTTVELVLFRFRFQTNSGSVVESNLFRMDSEFVSIRDRYLNRFWFRINSERVGLITVPSNQC